MEGSVVETPRRVERVRPGNTLIRRSFRELHGKSLYEVMARSKRLNAAGSNVMEWLMKHPRSKYARKFYDEREYFFFGDATDSRVSSFSWNKIRKDFTSRDIFPIEIWNANNRAVQLRPIA